MTRVLLSIGSNQNDPGTQLLKAYREMGKRFQNVKISNLYSTEPVGNKDQSPFLNAAIIIDTELTAPELLEVLLQIETNAGRSRSRESMNGPRNLDIDIILFGSETWLETDLVVPHPRFDQRRFVLLPAAEIAGDMKDPIYHKTIEQYLEDCTDTSWVEHYEQELQAL